MRKTSLLALFALLLCSRAFATLWHGTITQTITETNDPNLFVGQVLLGWYGYESDTIDGDFGAFNYAFTHPGAVPTLTGELNPINADYADEGGMLGLTTTHTWDTHLTVVNGEVTDFLRWITAGGYQGTFRFDTFTAFSLRAGSYGLMTFSDPQAVPDNFGTAGLLVVGMGALLGFRRKR